jgi:hypothetical protein
LGDRLVKTMRLLGQCPARRWSLAQELAVAQFCIVEPLWSRNRQSSDEFEFLSFCFCECFVSTNG